MNAVRIRHLFPALIPQQDAMSSAERNAVQRLIAVAELIEKSMSITEQPAMHARLRGALADVKSYGLEA